MITSLVNAETRQMIRDKRIFGAATDSYEVAYMLATGKPFVSGGLGRLLDLQETPPDGEIRDKPATAGHRERPKK